MKNPYLYLVRSPTHDRPLWLPEYTTKLELGLLKLFVLERHWLDLAVRKEDVLYDYLFHSGRVELVGERERAGISDLAVLTFDVLRAYHRPLIVVRS